MLRDGVCDGLRVRAFHCTDLDPFEGGDEHRPTGIAHRRFRVLLALNDRRKRSLLSTAE